MWRAREILWAHDQWLEAVFILGELFLAHQCKNLTNSQDMNVNTKQ